MRMHVRVRRAARDALRRTGNEGRVSRHARPRKDPGIFLSGAETARARGTTLCAKRSLSPLDPWPCLSSRIGRPVHPVNDLCGFLGARVEPSWAPTWLLRSPEPGLVLERARPPHRIQYRFLSGPRYTEAENAISLTAQCWKSRAFPVLEMYFFYAVCNEYFVSYAILNFFFI